MECVVRRNHALLTACLGVLFASIACTNEEDAVQHPPQQTAPASAPAPAPATPPGSADLEARLKKCNASLETQTRLATSCAAEKTALQEALDSAKEELRKLKATPSAVSQGITEAAHAASSVVEVDAALDRIQGFNDRFPGAPEKAVLKRIAKDLKKRRRGLAKQEAKAKALASISVIKSLLGEATDGSELAVRAQAALARHLVAEGMKYDAISALPRTNYAEAMKDPESERGKSVVVKGSVIQIQKEGGVFTGLICTRACAKVYHFITPGGTKGITQGKRARFAGILAQRYSYSNSGGGTTHSLALVGYFRGQE